MDGINRNYDNFKKLLRGSSKINSRKTFEEGDEVIVKGVEREGTVNKRRGDYYNVTLDATGKKEENNVFVGDMVRASRQIKSANVEMKDFDEIIRVNISPESTKIPKLYRQAVINRDRNTWEQMKDMIYNEPYIDVETFNTWWVPRLNKMERKLFSSKQIKSSDLKVDSVSPVHPIPEKLPKKEEKLKTAKKKLTDKNGKTFEDYLNEEAAKSGYDRNHEAIDKLFNVRRPLNEGYQRNRYNDMDVNREAARIFMDRVCDGDEWNSVTSSKKYISSGVIKDNDRITPEMADKFKGYVYNFKPPVNAFDYNLRNEVIEKGIGVPFTNSHYGYKFIIDPNRLEEFFNLLQHYVGRTNFNRELIEKNLLKENTHNFVGCPIYY